MGVETIPKLRKKLLAWYGANRRDLPWRRTKDPYRILVSEVMLQQTRVQTMLPYYQRFLALFPTVEALAAARPQRVLGAWSGLGYYSRARSLHAAARAIRDSGFPSTYEELIELPGVGRYTAAAVSSIAFGLPHAVLDGNVRRVVSRLFASAEAVEAKAQSLLDRRRPGDSNQAVMELGALVCLPRQPRCDACPLAPDCAAFTAGRVEQFPARRPRTPSRGMDLRLVVVERGGKILMAPPGGKWRGAALAGTGQGGEGRAERAGVRPGGSGRLSGSGTLWPEFWTLPRLPIAGVSPTELLGRFRHTVTFRRINVQVFGCRLTARGETALASRGFRFLSPAELARFPISTPARKALALANRGYGIGDRDRHSSLSRRGAVT